MLTSFSKTSQSSKGCLAMELSPTKSFLTAGDIIGMQISIVQEMLDGLFYGMWSSDIKHSIFIFTFHSDQVLECYSPSLHAGSYSESFLSFVRKTFLLKPSSQKGLKNSPMRSFLVASTAIMSLGSTFIILSNVIFDTVQIQGAANSYDPLPTMIRWIITQIIFTRISVSTFSLCH
jgi:hypothetical protein